MAFSAIALGVGVAAVAGGAMMNAKGAKEGAKGRAKQIEGQNLITQQAAEGVRDAGGSYMSYLEGLQERADADIKKARDFQQGIAEDRQFLYHQLGDPKYFDQTGGFGAKAGAYGSVETSLGTLQADDLVAQLGKKDTGGVDKKGNPIYEYSLPDGRVVHTGTIKGGQGEMIKNPEYDPSYPKDGRNRSKRTEYLRAKGGKKREPQTAMDLLSKDDMHLLELQGRLSSPAGQRVGEMTGISGGLLRGAMGIKDPIYTRFVEPTITSSAEQAAGLYRMAQGAWRDKLSKEGGSAAASMRAVIGQMENARAATAMHMDNVRTAKQNLQVFAIGNAQSQEMFNQLWVSGAGQGVLSMEFSRIALAMDTFWATNTMPMMAAGAQTVLQAEIQAAGIEGQVQTTAGQQEMMSAAQWSIAGGATQKIGGMLMSYGAGGLTGGATAATGGGMGALAGPANSFQTGRGWSPPTGSTPVTGTPWR